MADTLPPIVRPNGKTYRPRYLRVVGWDCEDDVLWQVAVLGTHDIAAARVLAPQGYHCPHLVNPTLAWMRLTVRDDESTWIYDDVRGAACVIFDESDDPPEVSAALRGDQPDANDLDPGVGS